MRSSNSRSNTRPECFETRRHDEVALRAGYARAHFGADYAVAPASTVRLNGSAASTGLNLLLASSFRGGRTGSSSRLRPACRVSVTGSGDGQMSGQ